MSSHRPTSGNWPRSASQRQRSLNRMARPQSAHLRCSQEALALCRASWRQSACRQSPARGHQAPQSNESAPWVHRPRGPGREPTHRRLSSCHKIQKTKAFRQARRDRCGTHRLFAYRRRGSPCTMLAQTPARQRISPTPNTTRSRYCTRQKTPAPQRTCKVRRRDPRLRRLPDVASRSARQTYSQEDSPGHSDWRSTRQQQLRLQSNR